MDKLKHNLNIRNVCQKGIALTDQKLLSGLVDFFNVTRTDVVLDIGCGRGNITTLLTSRTAHAVGLDVNTVFMTEARNRGVNVVMAKDRLPFFDSSFDKIILFHVLEHLTETQTDRLLEEIRRVLKPDGLLFAGVPVCGLAGWFIWQVRKRFLDPECRDHFGADDHCQFYTRNTFKAVFTKRSFHEVNNTKNIVIANSFGIFSFWAWYILRLMPFTLDTLNIFEREY